MKISSILIHESVLSSYYMSSAIIDTWDIDKKCTVLAFKMMMIEK